MNKQNQQQNGASHYQNGGEMKGIAGSDQTKTRCEVMSEESSFQSRSDDEEENENENEDDEHEEMKQESENNKNSESKSEINNAVTRIELQTVKTGMDLSAMGKSQQQLQQNSSSVGNKNNLI